MEINIIKQERESTLVSSVTDGVELRKYVPTEQVKNGTVTAAEFDAGIPYGLPFAEIVKPLLTSQEELPSLLEKTLHNAGVWTEDDVRSKRDELIGALQLIYGVSSYRIVTAVRDYAAAHKVALPSAPKKMTAGDKKPNKRGGRNA